MHGLGAGRRRLFGFAFLAALSALSASTVHAEYDWRADWEVDGPLALEIDSSGFRLPTAIAFVPEPSKEPGAPRYFVAELRGAIKVVTNDGQVRDFASVETFSPKEEYPYGDSEGGLAGLCLDAATGYVFGTYLYQDEHRVFRNAMVRFSTAPDTFAAKPAARVDFRDVFAPYSSGFSHQIGNCLVRDGSLYVGIGDGLNVAASQDTTQLAGKILRMDLDGRPHPGNPFAGDPDKPSAAYVWAYGLRNPFGLEFIGDRLFTVANGPDVDGLREIERGRNYYWDGTNWSMGTGMRVTFWPPMGPVHLVRLPPRSAVMPEWPLDHLLVAASGGFARGNGPAPNPPGVVAVTYNADADRFEQRPEYIARFTGKYEQRVTGIAATRDAVYFAAMLPDPDGRAYVMRLSHDPDPPKRAHDPTDALAVMSEKGCFACHQLDGTGGTQGPSLDSESLYMRLKVELNADHYEEQLAEIDAIDEEPFNKFTQARDEVRKSDGIVRMRTWVKYRVMEPRFDRTETVMPNLGLSEAEAETVTAFLLGRAVTPTWKDELLGRLKRPRVALLAGFGSGVLGTLFASFLLRRRSR